MNNIISVVTPSFNQGIFIDRTIRSVITQAGEFYIDYIIIDGGSTDETITIINKYQSELIIDSIPLHIGNTTYYTSPAGKNHLLKCNGVSYRWVSEPDRGQVHAINKGFLLANGNIRAFLNSDDEYRMGTFKKIVTYNWNDIHFLYGYGVWISASSKELCLYPTFNPDKYSLKQRCTLCQPAVFFSKAVYDDLGPFDEQYNFAFDYEYWVRAVFNGKKFKRVFSTLALSRMYKQNKSLSGRNIVSMEVDKIRNNYYFNEKQNRLLLFIKKLYIEIVSMWQEKIMTARLNQ